MEVTCENCGDNARADSEEWLRFIRLEATDTAPTSYLIVESNNSGARLLHRCVVEDD